MKHPAVEVTIQHPKPLAIMLAMAGWLFAACAGPGVRELALGPKVEALSSAHPATQNRERPAGLSSPPSDAPLHISSDRLEYREEGRVTHFSGHVKVRQDETRLSAPLLEVRSQENIMHASRGIQLLDGRQGITLTAQELVYQKDLSRVVASGKVKLKARGEQGQVLHMQSQTLEWQATPGIAQAQGGVTAQYQDITATAEIMIYNRPSQQLALRAEPPPNPEKPEALNAQLPRVLKAQDMLEGQAIDLDIRQRMYAVSGTAKAIILPPPEKPKEQP